MTTCQDFYIPVQQSCLNQLYIAAVLPQPQFADAPTKQAAFAQYKYPNAAWRYAKIADHLGLGGNTDEEKVELLIKAIEELQAKVNMPKTIKEAGVTEEKFYATLDEMVEQAFDDQCTGANPRYPLMRELKEMYINAFDINKSSKNEGKKENKKK